MMREVLNQTNSLPNVKLHKLDSKNIKEIARVHLEAFPESSWSKLGSQVVENYYRWQLEGPHELVLASGAFINGQCAGFCIGGVFNGSTSGFIRKNRFLLIRKILTRPWLIFDLRFVERLNQGIRLLKRFSSKKNLNNFVAVQPTIKSFGILSIAISPRYQNRGIGKKLLKNAEQLAAALGFEQMHLTVNPLNSNAIKFYENLSWQKSSSEKKWKGSMKKSI